MKQKFSILLFLLLLWFTGSQAVAQNAPNPFDIEQPSLRVFLPAPELATGRAVVACPGGGYSHLAVDHEGYDWAPYFNKQGIALIVLKYRMPNGDRTLPISDAEAAMKIVRDSADVWNLNPRDIGIMGSSAGGHLAASLSALWNDSEIFSEREIELAMHKPNAQILSYPVITSGEFAHKDSFKNLTGTDDESNHLWSSLSLERRITDIIPPTFLAYI